MSDRNKIELTNWLKSIMEETTKTINGKQYLLEVGVPSDKKERDDEGVTNAELMFFHENGAPLRNIPKRPVLAISIDYIERMGVLNKNLGKAIDIYFKSNKIEDFEKQLNILASKTENVAREIIYQNQGVLKPNAPSTIRKKGENYPLFDSSHLEGIHLARSIIARIVDESGRVV